MKKSMFLSAIMLFALVFSSAALNANPTETNVKIFYDQNGNLYNGMYYSYHGNGLKESELFIVEGKIQGKAYFYNQLGKIAEVGKYDDGLRQGQWTKYNEAGKVIATASFKNDQKDGEWKIYNDAGQILFEMHYALDKKTGTWRQWNDSGVLVAEKTY